MSRFSRALVLVATLSALGAVPVLAGPAEEVFLGKLAGSWSGGGTISGSENGKLNCTMAFKAVRKSVSFKGRCTTDQFGPQSFSGTLTYNEAEKRYEATSNSQTTIGVKTGNALVFTSKLRSIAGSGKSVMKLSASRVVIDTTLTRSQSGASIKSHVEMRK